MTDEVRRCVEAKTGFLVEYFSFPGHLQEEADGFIRDTEALGESCGSAVEFEQNFTSSGLSDRFNALVSKGTPKARKMTREEKRRSMSIAGDILYEQKDEMVKEAVSDVIDDFIGDKQEEQMERQRRQMIEDGTMADYTIRRNRIEAVGETARFLGGLFRNRRT